MLKRMERMYDGWNLYVHDRVRYGRVDATVNFSREANPDVWVRLPGWLLYETAELFTYDEEG